MSYVLDPLHWLLLALILVALPGAALAQQVQLPPITRRELSSGAHLVLMPYHRAPTVTVIAVFEGGEATDPDGKAGAVHLMADTLRKGTATRSAEQLAEEIDFLGGSLSCSSGLDSVAVALSVMTRDVDAGLALMADAVRSAAFPDKEVEQARDLAMADLQALPESPEDILDRALTQAAFPGHPYGMLPTMASLHAITRQDVLNAYQAIVTPAHMTIVAVGDFKPDDMAAKLKTRFGDWSTNTTPVATITPPAPPVPHIIVVDKPDATQTQAAFVWPGFRRNDPDHTTATVASAMLGGTFTSRLVQEVRVRRSLTYGIGLAFRCKQAGGIALITTFTRTESTRQLVNTVRETMTKAVANGFTDEEMTRVRGYLAGAFAVDVQAPTSIAKRLADIALYHLPNDTLNKTLERQKAVTQSAASSLVKRYLDPKAWTIVLVGKADAIMKQMEGLGPVQRLTTKEILQR